MASEALLGASNGTLCTEPDPQRTYRGVVAATPTMGIGKDGKLPWSLPSDLKFFKDITMTMSDLAKKNAIIMGSKTWESIPLEHRPLTGLLSVVLTRSGSFDITTAENVLMCGSMTSVLELLASSPYCLSIETVFVIGGGQRLSEYLNAPGVMLSILLKSKQISIVTLSSLLLMLRNSSHGTRRLPWWKIEFATYARVRNSAVKVPNASMSDSNSRHS